MPDEGGSSGDDCCTHVVEGMGGNEDVGLACIGQEDGFKLAGEECRRGDLAVMADAEEFVTAGRVRGERG